MIKQVDVKRVYVNTEDKNGNKYINKNGDAYALVIIENEDGQKASMYAELKRDDWKIKKAKELEGKTETLDFEKKGEYLNWDFPRKSDLLEDRVKQLEEKMVFVLDMLEQERVEEIDDTKLESSEPGNEDVDPSELPF